MSLKRFSLAFVFPTLFLASCGTGLDAGTPSARVAGTFNTQFIDYDFTLFLNQPQAADIERYIARENPSRSDPLVSNAQLATLIRQAASAFSLDGAVLTALIRKESSFDRFAVSATGAAGLTQMTEIGIQEVHDQLGMRGASYARAAATQWLTEAAKSTVPGWTEPWLRPGGNSMSGIKAILKADAATSIVYGAVLLKTTLSDCRKTQGDLDLDPLYRCALKKYNGDPAEMENYQKKIMSFAEAVAP